ncbi:unnamed protein product [Meloidogyne enterolobii]|uniref:Uncharacterized protein n=1 Tax=Meloidogyne enterolobii TaxID=390850 RepID=A0ACB0ZHY1_MELEN
MSSRRKAAPIRRLPSQNALLQQQQQQLSSSKLINNSKISDPRLNEKISNINQSIDQKEQSNNLLIKSNKNNYNIMNLTCSASENNPSSSRLKEEMEENALNEGREEEEGIDSNLKEEEDMEGNEGEMEEGEEETDEEMEENKNEEDAQKEEEERDEYKEEEEEILTIKRKKINKNLAVDPQIASTSYCHDIKGNSVKDEQKGGEEEDLMNTEPGDQQLLNKPFQHQQLSTTTFSPSTLPHNNCIAKHQTFTDPNIQTPQKQTLNFKQNNNKVYLNEQQQNVLEETFDENKLENKLVLNGASNVVVNGENLKHENERWGFEIFLKIKKIFFPKFST